jgi:hypothetical protein
VRILHLDTLDRGEQHFALVGALTEDFLGPVLMEGTRILRINMKEVTRVNSGGVRSWLQWLNPLSTELDRRFEECSFAVTQQATNISNFLLGSIVSYYVPYFCEACSGEAVMLIEAPSLPQSTRPCAVCGATMTLDVPMEMLLGLFEKAS